jgi:hypothetical protein
MPRVRRIPRLGESHFPVQYREGKTVRDVLPMDQFGDDDVVVVQCNDQLVTFDHPLLEGDEVTWCLHTGTGIELGTIIITAIISTAISTALSFAISAIMGAPKDPIEPDGDETETYTFGGIRNTTHNGAHVNVVFGEHLVGGNILEMFTLPDQYGNDRLYMLVQLGIGEFDMIGGQTADVDDMDAADLQDVFFNKNPSSNYDGVTASVRMGTPDQSSIPGFHNAVSPIAINFELVNTSGSERTDPGDEDEAYTFTTPEAVQEIRINILHPRGLYRLNDQGGLAAWKVKYRYRYKLTTDELYGEWTEVQVERRVRTAFSSAVYLRDLDLDTYDVQVQRVSVDNDRIDRENSTTLSRIDDVTYLGLKYPGRALLAIKGIANESFQGSFPTITTKVRGMKVRTPLDGMVTVPAGSVVVTGLGTDFTSLAVGDYISVVNIRREVVAVNSATELEVDRSFSESELTGRVWLYAWSQNNADIALELLTNTKIGLGQSIDDTRVDLDEYDEFRNYCNEEADKLDGTGEFEDRSHCDLVIDRDVSVWEATQDIVQAARTKMVLAGNQVRFIINRPRAVSQLFTDGNIVRGSLNYAWSSQFNRPNVFQVQFFNEQLNYEPDSIRARDKAATVAGKRHIVEDIRLASVTRMSQAAREANFRNNVNQAVGEMVSFEASVDALACEAGDIIELAVWLPARTRANGRLVGAGNQSVQLDRSVTLEADVQYFVRVRLSDDTLVTKEVDADAGYYAAGDDIRLADTWDTNPSQFDLYAFGEETLLSKKYEITSISMGPELRRRIEAVEYIEAVYTDENIIIEKIDDTDFDDDYTAPGVVQDLDATVRTEEDPISGDQRQVVDISWDPPNDNIPVLWYQIFVREFTFNTFYPLGDPVLGTEKTIRDALETDTAYEFTVVAVGIRGDRLSEYVTPTVSVGLGLAGDRPPPPDSIVVGNTNNGYTLAWTPVDQVEIMDYEVRLGGAEDQDGELLGYVDQDRDATTISAGPYYLPPGQSSIKFRVRSRNFAGRMSSSYVDGTTSTVSDISGATLLQTDDMEAVFNSPLVAFNIHTVDDGLELIDPSLGSGFWWSDYTQVGSSVALSYFNTRFDRDVKYNDEARIRMLIFRSVSRQADSWHLGELVLPPYPEDVITLQIFIRTSSENVAANPDPGLFSSWVLVEPDENWSATCRWYQIKVEMTYNETDDNSEELYLPRLEDLKIAVSR